MSILPKFLYLIQALPIQIPFSFIKQVHALFTRFVWAHKKPRLSRTSMTLRRSGPTGYQTILFSHLGRILDWRRNAQTKLWVQLEQSQTHIPLKGTLWCYNSLPSDLKSHPLIGTTLRHSSRTVFHSSLTTRNSPLFPILGHPSFSPGLHPSEYSTLRDSGCDHAAKFVSRGKWPSIVDLTEAAGPFQLPFWEAAQIHHFLHSIPNPQDFSRQLTTFEDLCSETGPISHMLSQTYTLLNTPPEQPQLHCISSWEADLDLTFSTAQKQRIIHFALKSSLCTKTQEMNFKLLTRWYLTPSRLHKCFPSSSDRCWRCGEEEGSLLHISWSCPRLQNF